MRQVQFDGSTFAYEWYRGQTLKGTVDCPIAFDTETQAIPPYRQPLPHEDPADLPPSPLIVPPVAVGMAFDGTSLYLIHPSRLAEFVAKNRNQQWVGQNFAFDFWVLMEEANRVGDRVTQEFLWSMGDANKFSDTAVLDLLVQLGTGKYRYGAGKGEDTKLFMANLAVLSEQYGCGELDKEDPYRLRFGEWVGLSEEQIEAHPEFEGFASYALKDVIATWRVYPHQRKQAVGIMRRAGWSDRAGQETYEIRPDALRLFGPLSEYLQVKGSIVLSKLSRTPVYIDQQKRAEMEAATRERYQKHMDALNSMIPVLFKRYSPKAKKGKAGQIRYNKKTGLPEMSTIILKGRLECEAETLGITPPVSKGKKKEISCSTKDWAQWADQSEFLTAWCGLGSEVKLMSFLIALDSPDGKAYSNYNLLMRTGRTSAQAHRKKKVTLVPSFNIQQMPRDSDKHPERSVRQLFRPPAGHKWYSNDYGYIELCSLASVCKARFGWSDMAEIITGHRTKGGMDPHQTMAAVIMGLTPEQFLALPKTTQKEYRQKAKACFHPDTELLTSTGWVKITDVTMDTKVAQFCPDGGGIEFTTPLALTCREDCELLRIHNSSVDVRVTPDHRMVGLDNKYNLKVVPAEQVNDLLLVWHANVVNLCPLTALKNGRIHRNKTLTTSQMMEMPFKWRKDYIEEKAQYKPVGSSGDGRWMYTTRNKEEADRFQALCTVTGYRSVMYSEKGSVAYTVSAQTCNYTKGEPFQIDKLAGRHKVYCLSVPSSYVVVRDGGKTLCVGNCNFGYPGGLGVATFLLYAAQNYGVSFTPKEAKEVKEKWLELYPEMTKYLSDPTELAMRWQSDRKVAPKMGYLMRKRLSDYLRATDREREAKGYDPEEVGRFWDLLKWIAKTKNDPDLLADCEQQIVTGRVRNLMTYRACSLTGRVRNNVTFTAGANTPFQGLAGDGAKLALWTLMRKGVHLLGFVHDSIEVALPIGKEQSIKKTVDQVMVDSMQKVLGQGVPVAVDGAIGDCWSKA